MDWMASFFCHEGSLQGICSNIIFVLCGFDEPQVNKTLLETIMHHTPAGASTDSFVHFAQEINSSKGRNFKTHLSTEEVHIAHCGNFMIFLSLRFYVKSILGIVEVQNLPFSHI